jgi:hypothetical protein
MPNKFAKQLEKLKHKKKLLVILIFALVSVLVWIVVGIFSAQTKLGVSPALTAMAKPLTPTLKGAVLETIEQKKYYPENQLEAFPIFAIIENEEGTGFSVIDVVNNRINTVIGAESSEGEELEATTSGDLSSPLATSAAEVDN